MEHLSTEEEQIEAIKKFWKENGIAIVVGAVLGLGGLWGWRAYNDHVLSSQEIASDKYNDVMENISGDNKDLTAASTFINDNSDTSYAVLTSLQLAKAAVDVKDFPEAKKQLQWVIANSKEESIVALSSIRLARVQNEEQDFDAALASLDAVTLDAFKAQVLAVKGDILVNKGELAEAQQSYSEALALEENNNLLQMKIDDLNAKVSGTAQNG